MKQEGATLSTTEYINNSPLWEAIRKPKGHSSYLNELDTLFIYLIFLRFCLRVTCDNNNNDHYDYCAEADSCEW